MKPSKKVTIDDLVSMIKLGFDHVDSRFEKVDQTLAELGNGLAAANLRLTNVAYRFELVDLEKRVYRLEHKSGISKR